MGSLETLLASSEGDVHQLFEVRRILEGETAALAAVRRTDEQLERLLQTIDEMEAGLQSEERYIGADIDFHLILAEATGNRFVVHLMHAIRDQLRSAFGTVFHVPGSPERSVAEHRAVAEAIGLLQPELARERMNQHISRVEAGFDS
jgi:GntR family transcriptional repressor for pyruvate dehydrogenase complex